MKSLKISRKEAAKVTHDINNVWHERFSDKEVAEYIEFRECSK